VSAVPAIDPTRAPELVRAHLAATAQRIDTDLDRRLAIPAHLGPRDPERNLREAMRYAVLGGGKRLRPALVLAAAQACHGSIERALPAAAAVELLHAYTLVHDDLPAMDDDEVRRGRATVHVAYGEAVAILAGDGLLTLAFAALADLGEGAAAAVSTLATAAGAGQLLAGQARDLALEGAEPAMSEVELIHSGKTGALFAASAELGAIAARAPQAARDSLRAYGMAIGVAFQHADDSDDDELPGLAERAYHRRRELAFEALDATGRLADPTLLAELARWIGGL
jgi:geranylgeranyl pyrophosphate synthase